LAILWTNNVNITIVGFNNNMIDCYVMSNNNSDNWRATCIYGFPRQDKKIMTCNLINKLKLTNPHDQWLVFGDFNLIMHPSEKQGGRDHHHNIMNLALDMLNNCNLIDLGYHGDPFTWTNNQVNGDHIKERIDRFCATTSWLYFTWLHEPGDTITKLKSITDKIHQWGKAKYGNIPTEIKKSSAQD
jgi:hypothetical protein